MNTAAGPSAVRACLAWLAIALAALASLTTAAEPAKRTRLSETDEIWIDPAKRELIVGGSVVLDKGPIELFACTKNSKEHESIVAVNAKASVVHAGLLALGLEPGRPVSFDPEYVAASGPGVAVRMRWKDADGTVREVRAQEWIRDTRTGKAMTDDWLFAGSSVWTDESTGQRHYQADDGDLVCVSNFPTAMLDLPITSSQSNEQLLFEVMEDAVPARGTAVEMILSPARK